MKRFIILLSLFLLLTINNGNAGIIIFSILYQQMLIRRTIAIQSCLNNDSMTIYLNESDSLSRKIEFYKREKNDTIKNITPSFACFKHKISNDIKN